MTKTEHIPTLDGIRAIAILVVMASHAFHDNPMLADLGHMGVMLFFALSGYLITTRLLAEHAKNGEISLRRFYLRRAFRILPPALTYITVVAAMTTAGIMVCGWPSLRAALLFYINYVDPGVDGWRVTHFWSLSVEEHFYALWPLALIGFGVARGWRTALVFIVGIIAWRATDHYFHILEAVFHNANLHWNVSGTDAIADALLWGCVLSFFKFKLHPNVSVVIALAAAVLLALITMHVRLPPPHNIEFVTTLEHLLPAIFLGAIVSFPGSIIGRFLELSPMRFIGHLSYSLYIWQQLFLGGPGPKLPALLGIMVVFGFAYLSYHFVEQPCISLGRKIMGKLSQASLAPSGRKWYSISHPSQKSLNPLV